MFTSSRIETVFRRYVTILVSAMWMGGFTFYAEIVIPTAAKVLGSERQVGFVTERVTHWLNLIGLAALAVFFWNIWAEWRRQTRGRRRLLAGTWVAMVLCHIGLFLTHPLIEQVLDFPVHHVRDYERFIVLHNVYLAFATAQWAAALTYLWLSLRAWQAADHPPAPLG